MLWRGKIWGAKKFGEQKDLASKKIWGGGGEGQGGGGGMQAKFGK